ncbi:hypothetical protein [Corynebacterium liangguodongii]|uniref:Uncharacterized protein n=1 Tax=Corynebacterium liangguodongii TaxID=2079535 RepID=A0A2S0WG84_9CORY|nr:hypothetical protein [Corynebacterium liangguodongii]AWB84798.1 hypothetical protein C3E79_10195 [Corynebacterium liangguodongii]PWB99155.1 hypothetical protein DF219_07810 [Corynebacterium liangguodongii]
MTAAQTLIWETAGRPGVTGAKGKLLKPEPAICAITGEYCEVTADATRALGENFTDQSLWRAHTGRVGQAALWCCSGKGKDSPRMWSWVCAPGHDVPDSVEKAPLHVPGLCQTNRGNTRPIIDTLMSPPAGEWVVCVAVSGQKHVLPYATTNRGVGEWTIRMEDTTITATPTQWRTVFESVLALRRLGIPADSIKTGRPDHIKTLEKLRWWQEYQSTLAPYQTSPLVDLALWCITKPIMEDNIVYTYSR